MESTIFCILWIPQYKKELILAGEPELAKKVMDIREENQIFEL